VKNRERKERGKIDIRWKRRRNRERKRCEGSKLGWKLLIIAVCPEAGMAREGINGNKMKRK
jgi:hypothetical protein